MTKIILTAFLYFYVGLVLASTNSKVEEATSCGNLYVKFDQKFLDCLARKESNLIQLYKGKVVRKGAAIKVRLRNGKFIKFINSKNSSEIGYFVNGKPATEYRVEEYFPKQGFYIVNKHLFEGDSYLLISDVDGRSLEVQGYPQFSPDGKRFVSPYDDAFDDTPSIYIYLIKDGSISLEFKSEVSWPEFEVKWNNNIELILSEWSLKAPSSKPLAKYVWRDNWSLSAFD